MTNLAELTGERIELNPDVPFPPFPVWLRLPSAWSQLDSNPATWRRSADDLIDTTFRGSRLPARERRDIVTLLEGLVADCQRAGAALSLITVGRRAAGGAASFGLHVAFAGDSRPSSIGRVHDILPRTGVAAEISTASGPGVLHRDRMTMVVPGTAEIAVLTTIQAFVPIPDSTWTVVLSTASAHPELTDALESMLRSAAESVRTEHPVADGQTTVPARASSAAASGSADAYPDGKGNGNAGADDGDGARRTDGNGAGDGNRNGNGNVAAAGDGPLALQEWPVERPAAPGIERGFSTLVLRRIEPPEPAGPAG